MVILLRRHHAAGKSVSYLARYFSLSRQCVSGIVNGRTHPNVVDIGQPLEVYEPVSKKPRDTRPGPAPDGRDNTVLSPRYARLRKR